MTTRKTRIPGGLPTALLVSAEQAADRLGVGTQTVYRLIQQGQLPAVRVSGTPGTPGMLRIRVRDLEQWVGSLPTIGT